MTEKLWCESTDLIPMFDWLRGNNRHRNKSGRRKLRLFACACCHRVQSMMTPVGVNWLELSNRFAESKLTTEERRGIDALNVRPRRSGTANGADNAAFWALATNVNDAIFVAARESANAPIAHLRGDDWKSKIDAERFEQCRILRDIFGNPFRPVTLDPRWLSSTVLDLARTIYEQRTFEHLPILADALMDAGCDSEEIVNHCRGDGPHVRGCWVVDLLLGKE
jgi:hypothetical protein